MTIEDLIEDIVSGLTANGVDYEFLSSEESYANALSDEFTNPMILLLPVVYDAEIKTGGHWSEVSECMIIVTFKSNLDDNPTKQREYVEKAKLAIKEIILKIDDNEDVTNLKMNKIRPLLNFTDVNRSGASIDFTFELRNNTSVCI